MHGVWFHWQAKSGSFPFGKRLERQRILLLQIYFLLWYQWSDSAHSTRKNESFELLRATGHSPQGCLVFWSSQNWWIRLSCILFGINLLFWSNLFGCFTSQSWTVFHNTVILLSLWKFVLEYLGLDPMSQLYSVLVLLYVFRPKKKYFFYFLFPTLFRKNVKRINPHIMELIENNFVITNEITNKGITQN